MTTGSKNYYASEGWRKLTLISAVLIFCLALWFLFEGIILANNVYFGLPFFIVNFLVGLAAIHDYLRARYLPAAQAGSGWIIIRYGTRNRRAYTAHSRVKDIRINNTDVQCVRNGLLLLMICTVDGYRYFISGLANRDRQELLQRLRKKRGSGHQMGNGGRTTPTS